MNEKTLRKRRKTRHPHITDVNDPVLIQNKAIEEGVINSNFADKFALKHLASHLFLMAKPLFSFNSQGKLISGEVPKNQMVILKYNRGSDSRGIKIINSGEITTKLLSDFVRDQKQSDIYHKKMHEPYRKFDKVFFAEEYKEEFQDAEEYKIFLFKNQYFVEVSPKKQGNLARKMELNMYDSEGLPVESPIVMQKAIKGLNKSIVHNIKNIRDDLYALKALVGGFCRVDIFIIDGRVWLNEVTITPGAPDLHWYDKEAFKWYKSSLKQMGLSPSNAKFNDIDKEQMDMFLDLLSEEYKKGSDNHERTS